MGRGNIRPLDFFFSLINIVKMHAHPEFCLATSGKKVMQPVKWILEPFLFIYYRDVHN